MSLPRAALLAGGLGTRIRAVAGDTPKVLLPVERRPFIAHLLDFLARQGVEEAVLCLGHQADRVWEAARAHAPKRLRLLASREESLLGTAGALRRALSLLGDPFFVLNGDTFLEASLVRLHEFHRNREASLTLTLVRSEAAAEKGSVRIDPEGRVLDFSEKVKDGTGLINAGLYVVSAAAFESVPEDAPASLERDVIPRLIREGKRVAGLVEEGPFVDIGLPEDYMRVRNRLPGPGDAR